MARGTDRKDALNVIAAGLSTFGALSFATWVHLVFKWIQSAPNQPDPARGLVLSFDNHGSIVYFSAFQGTSYTLLFVPSLLSIGLGAWLSPKKEVVRRGVPPFFFSMVWKPNDPRKLWRYGVAWGATIYLVMVLALGPALVKGLNSIGLVAWF